MSLLKVVAPADDESVSDAVLLRRFQQGRDPQAAELLVRRHGRLVMGVCSRILGRSGEADDAFQATFLVLIRGGLRIRQSQSLASWLYGTAWRVAIRLRKKLNRQRSLEACPEPLCEGDPFEQLVAKHDQEVLDKELAGLTERYREVLLLHYFEGQSQREIARTLGATESAVEGLLKRGRAQLRARLSRRGVIFATTVTAVAAQHSALQAAAWAPQVNVILEGATTLSPQVWEAVLRAPRAEELLQPEWTIMGLQKLSLSGVAVGSGAVIASLLGWSLLGAALSTGTGEGPTTPAAGITSSEISEGAAEGPAIEAAAPVPDQPVAAEEGGSSFSGIAAPGGGLGSGVSDGPGLSGSGVLLEGAGMGGAAGLVGVMSFPSLSLPLDPETVDDLLSRPMQTGFSSLPWRIALDQIRIQALPLDVNDEELQQFGVQFDEPITMQIGQVPIRTALRLLLKPKGLEVRLVDGKLKIVRSEGPGAQASSTAQPGTGAAHRLHSRPALSETALHIADELRKSTEASFAEAPLQEALDYLKTLHSIQVVLEEVAMTDAGIGTDTPVTLELKDVTLRSTLNMLLEPQGLTYVLEDEVMKITTIEAAKQKRHRRVYDLDGFSDSVIDVIRQNELLKVERLDNPRGSAPLVIVTGNPKALEDLEDLLRDLQELTQPE